MIANDNILSQYDNLIRGTVSLASFSRFLIYWIVSHLLSRYKKLSFPLWIYSVNVTKSAVSCGFGHIY